MRERPILFSAPMVRALLAGKKTQTRRIRRQALDEDATCPYGEAGDRLWVRETWGIRGSHWCNASPDIHDVQVAYRADAAARVVPISCAQYDANIGKQRCRADCDGDPGGKHGDELTAFWRKWRPAIHMPRWASRIELVVVGVGCEALQDISEEDARAEGVEPFDDGDTFKNTYAVYRDLWNSINGQRAPWGANPYVWAIEFKVLA
jgi:hypothetical protein